MPLRYGMWRYDFFLQCDRIPGDGEIEWRSTGLTTPTSRRTNPRLVQATARSQAAPPAETRSREEYYLSLREKVAVGQQSAAAEDRTRAGNWDQTAELSRWMWTEYRRRWPPEDHPDGTSS